MLNSEMKDCMHAATQCNHKMLDNFMSVFLFNDLQQTQLFLCNCHFTIHKSVLLLAC